MSFLAFRSSFFFLLLLLLFSISTLTAAATMRSGTIQRITKQQILVTIPPNAAQASEPILSSPSGKYTAFLLRHDTAPGAGGFGNDFCYIQVQDTSSGQSVWESECAPVSSENACTLVFDDNGLEVFDGSNSVWNNNAESADDNPLETLEMVDEGDMRIRDQVGELAWKASDDPRANQGCGLPGSPGLAPEKPAFSVPIGGQQNLPFGQQQQQQPASGGGVQGFGFGAGAFESGCNRIGFGWALVVALVGLWFVF